MSAYRAYETRLGKKAEEGMSWYMIAFIIALVLVAISLVIIAKVNAANGSIIDFLREMF